MNGYAYSGNDPVSASDPSGLNEMTIIEGGGGADLNSGVPMLGEDGSGDDAGDTTSSDDEDYFFGDEPGTENYDTQAAAEAGQEAAEDQAAADAQAEEHASEVQAQEARAAEEAAHANEPTTTDDPTPKAGDQNGEDKAGRGHAQPPSHGPGVTNGDPTVERWPGGRPDGQSVISGHGTWDAVDGTETQVPQGTWCVFYCEDGATLSDGAGLAVEQGLDVEPSEIAKPGTVIKDLKISPPSNWIGPRSSGVVAAGSS